MPNRYPILSPEGPGCCRGEHEVLIEQPDHHATWSTMPADDLARVLGAYAARARVLADRPGSRYVFMFRNQGRRAGASLEHPHGHVLAWDPEPANPGRNLEPGDRAVCTGCGAIEEAERSGTVIAGTPDHVVLAAPEPRFDYETWILPREHRRTWFEDAAFTRGALTPLVSRLERALGSVRRDPAYNVVVRGAPEESGPAGHHWRMEVVPRFHLHGGFELATGWNVVTVSPADAARALRGAVPW